MPNEFSKEERVAFEDILAGFDDAQVMARNVRVYSTDQQAMERSGDIIWRPMPYVARSFDGLDQTPNFFAKTQLSVPATIGFVKSSPWKMTARELRDALQEGRLGDAAKLKLASDINVAVLNVATLQGSLFVKIATAAAGFADVALCEAIMNEQGVPMGDRYLALSTRDYNGMANNLAGRGTVQGKVLTAYEKAYIGLIGSFDSFKLDYTLRKALAAGGAGITISTLAAGGNVFVPMATRVGTTGERGNLDNRFQQVVVSSTTSVVAGDAFTIATVDAVHHITKQDTGQLKTFRVISVDDATHMTICPPLITGQGGTEAELQYQNCVVNTPAAGSAIVFLNTATGPMNAFWAKDSIEILPGRLAFPTDAGMAVMRGTTDQGIELCMTKQADIKTGEILYRLDTLFGAVNLNPEMNGVVMFSQP
jgi:hypothetical protein